MPSGLRFAILTFAMLLVGIASAGAQDEFSSGSADMNTSSGAALRCAQLLSRNFGNPDYRAPPECRADVTGIEDQARDLQRRYGPPGTDEGGTSRDADRNSGSAFRCAQLLSRNFENANYRPPPECRSVSAGSNAGSADMDTSSQVALRCAQLLSLNFGNPNYRPPPECRANDRRIEDQARELQRR